MGLVRLSRWGGGDGAASEGRGQEAFPAAGGISSSACQHRSSSRKQGGKLAELGAERSDGDVHSRASPLAEFAPASPGQVPDAEMSTGKLRKVGEGDEIRSGCWVDGTWHR